MRLTPLLLPATLLLALSVEAAEFREIRLEEDGTRLTIVQSDGVTFAAPKFEDQDSFEKPSISSDRRYAGWLAGFQNQGASYSQPRYLVVLDTANRLRRFSGDFGMVFGWCFAKDSDAVIYRFQFPHGMTPIGFEMRRVNDGKLLHHLRFEPVRRDQHDSQVIRTKAPVWTKCAQNSAGTE